MDSYCCGQLNTCVINQIIDSKAYVLGSVFVTTIERFDMSDNRKVKFLPGGIGGKFPNLKEFWAEKCGLTIVRDYSFTEMRNLRYLNLYDNKIAVIESGAFRNLISLKALWLDDNQIETLDDKLLASMVKLEQLYLMRNKIKFLSSAIFNIPGGKLIFVDLRYNTCINWNYDSSQREKLIADLMANCT